MNEVLIIIITLSILLFILSLLLYFIGKRVYLITKKLYVDKVSEFDILMEDKEKKLTALNDSIEEKQKTFNELEEELEKKRIMPETKSGTDDVVLPKNADFADGNLFESYKVIKERFTFDTERLVAKFINKIVRDDNANYETYKRIRSYFTYDVIYRLHTYLPSEQYTIVLGLLSDSEKEAVKSLLNSNRFKIDKFIKGLDELIVESNPEIKIFVGDKNANYDNLNSYITTIYDEKIAEGLKILYKGILYDYSI